MPKKVIFIVLLACSLAVHASFFDSNAKYLCQGTQNLVFEKSWVLEYKDKVFSIDGQPLKRSESDQIFSVSKDSINIQSPKRSIYFNSGVLKVKISKPNGGEHLIEAKCNKTA